MRDPTTTQSHHRYKSPPQRSQIGEVAVARALFANESEWPNELNFERGETLRIVDYRSDDDDGWLLCVNARGERGFAPANRLEIMHRFENDRFFQIAHPFFDDFFMFRDERSPFDNSFFDRAPRLFPSANPSRISSPAPSLTSISAAIPQPVRRLSATNETTSGVVRNIPIRVQNQPSNLSPQPTRKIFGEAPVPPTRRYHNVVPLLPTTSSSDEDNAQRALNTFSGDYDFPKYQKEVISSPIENPRNETSLRSHAGFPSEKRIERLSQNAQRDSSDSSLYTSDPSKFEKESEDSGISSTTGTNSTSFTPVSQDLRPNELLNILKPALKPAPKPIHNINMKTNEQINYSPSTSTSVLETLLDDLISSSSKQMPTGPPALLPKPVISWKGPINLEDDVRQNNSPHWSNIPTIAYEAPAPPPKTIEAKNHDWSDDAVQQSEMQTNKIIVITQLATAERQIVSAVETMKRATAPQFWRAPQVLQQHLEAIRDACHSLHDNLDIFVDATARITISVKNSKNDELLTLINPLRNTRNVVCSLRRQLDSAGWRLAVLARDQRHPRTGLDALEQFLHIAQSLPKECHTLWEWARVLPPGPQITFLPSPNRTPYQLTTYSPRSSDQDDEKRLSTSSSSTLTSGESMPSSSSSSGSMIIHNVSPPLQHIQPPSILATNKTTSGNITRGRVMFVDEKPHPEPLATTSGSERNSLSPSETESERETPVYSEITKYREPEQIQANLQHSPASSTAVLEEDDLESVTDDRDSLFQDYAILDDVVPGRKTHSLSAQKFSLSPHDLFVIKEHRHEFEQISSKLSTAIDEFLETVEASKLPQEFKCKGKAIVMLAHRLVYLGDDIAQGLRCKELSDMIRTHSDTLCSALEKSVDDTILAAQQFPNVAFIQTMVDSVLAVASQAKSLKHYVMDT